MSTDNPCLTCGACCAHFRVSFYWGECRSAGGVVPDELTVRISPQMVAMSGTENKPARCVGLLGEVGCGVRCTVYEQRSSTYARALASRQPDAAEEALAKARNMPLRAPLLVVAVACLQDHPKVPHAEQLLAAGCAAHGLVLGAYAQGLGAMWRTGEMATDPVVHAGLGLGEQERIIGFVYLGTPMGELRTPTELDPTAFVSAWPG